MLDELEAGDAYMKMAYRPKCKYSLGENIGVESKSEESVTHLSVDWSFKQLPENIISVVDEFLDDSGKMYFAGHVYPTGCYFWPYPRVGRMVRKRI
jgi:hypothetical protein